MVRGHPGGRIPQSARTLTTRALRGPFLLPTILPRRKPQRGVLANYCRQRRGPGPNGCPTRKPPLKPQRAPWRAVRPPAHTPTPGLPLKALVPRCMVGSVLAPCRLRIGSLLAPYSLIIQPPTLSPPTSQGVAFWGGSSLEYFFFLIYWRDTPPPSSKRQRTPRGFG